MTAPPWFRLYTEARTDRKLARLTSEQFRVWFNLLCYAAEQGANRGTIKADIEMLVTECGDVTLDDDANMELLTETLQLLHRLRIIEWQSLDDGEEIVFLNFVDRQYDKPSDTPEQTRLRKQESRNRAKNGTSRDVTPGHAQVTPTSHPVTHIGEERITENHRGEERNPAPARTASAAVPPKALPPSSSSMAAPVSNAALVLTPAEIAHADSILRSRQTFKPSHLCNTYRSKVLLSHPLPPARAAPRPGREERPSVPQWNPPPPDYSNPLRRRSTSEQAYPQ